MSPTSTILDAIPDPLTIRSRLAQLMREQDLLRSLLRVSERKQRDLNHGAGDRVDVREGKPCRP